MLTLKSKFSEFVDICTKAGACLEAVEWMNKQLALNKDMTFGEAMKNFVSDEKALEGWASWNIERLGKELGSDAIDGFISKIKNEMSACQIYIKCAPVLTTAQDTTLKAVYEGKLPIAEKELRDRIITRTTAEVAP
jgi:hypothetical protein